MTVTVQIPFTEYIAAPGATTFATTFRLIELDDLLVTVNGAIVTSGFTVSGLPLGPTSNVIFALSMLGGEAIRLERSIKLERLNSYQFEGDFQANVVNEDFDRLWMSQQDQEQSIADNLTAQESVNLRTLRAPSGEVLAQLPAASLRNGFLRFLPDGSYQILNIPDGDSSSALRADLGNNTDPLKGSALLGTVQLGVATVGRTVQSKLNALKLESDYATEAQFNASSLTSARHYTDGRIDPFVKPAGELENARLATVLAKLLSGASVDGRSMQSFVTDQARNFPRKYYPTTAWFELLRLSPNVQPFEDTSGNVKMTEAYVREVVDQMAATGINTIVIPYVEYFGYWFYQPAFAFPADQETSSVGQYWHTKLADSRVENFDPVTVIMRQAQRNDMQVFLGLGRNGDSQLLQDLYNINILAQADPNRFGTSINTRLSNATIRTRQVAADLFAKFSTYRSFAGWYISHEPGHLGASNNYLSAVCNTGAATPALSSYGKPIMVAPGNTVDAAATVAFADLMVASGCTVFAPQDAVGPGNDFSTGFYTYTPARALATLSAYMQKWDGARRIADSKLKTPSRNISLIITADAWEMGIKPAATLTPSGVSGSITLAASSSVFTAADIGKIVWINGGQANIIAQAGTSITATTTRTLSGVASAAAGNWAMTTAVNGGYTQDYPANWSRVQNQLYELWPYVDGVSLYSWFGHIDSGTLSLRPSQVYAGRTDYRTLAANLYANYQSYVVGQRSKYLSGEGPVIVGIQTFEIGAQVGAASVGVDFGTYYPKHDGSQLLVLMFANYTTSPATATAAALSLTLRANGAALKTTTDVSNVGTMGGAAPLFLTQLPRGGANLYRVEIATTNGTVNLLSGSLLVIEITS